LQKSEVVEKWALELPFEGRIGLEYMEMWQRSTGGYTNIDKSTVEQKHGP
jgi:hypothetical protein